MSTRGSSQQSGAAGWMGAFKLWLRGFCLQLNAEPQKDFNAESNKCVIWNKNGISRQCPRYVGRNIKHAMNKISSEIRKPQRKRCMETDVPSQGQKKISPFGDQKEIGIPVLEQTGEGFTGHGGKESWDCSHNTGARYDVKPEMPRWVKQVGFCL